MPNPTVFRISLVDIFSAENSERTPYPFLEVRAFMFLDKVPQGTSEIRIRNTLRKWIELVKEEFLYHIFENDKGMVYPETSRQITPFLTTGTISPTTRIAIEGYEISEVDRDEIIFHHFDYKLRKNMEFTLSTDPRIYLYVAFYDQKMKGQLKKEYDDSEIRQYLRRTYQVEKSREAFFQKAKGTYEEAYAKTKSLEQTFKEIDEINKIMERNFERKDRKSVV